MPDDDPHARLMLVLGNQLFPAAHLRAFLQDRFERFGDYEDALSGRGDWLFHSVLSPVMNLGLITPGEIIGRALDHAQQHGTSINCVEGFVRQVIGWREFIRGVYQNYSEIEEQENSFNHRRTTKPYVCGSNYLIKMSDYQKGAWCDTADGLYWRFVASHRAFFASNPRMSVMTRSLDKLEPQRKARIFSAAEQFMDDVTEVA